MVKRTARVTRWLVDYRKRQWDERFAGYCRRVAREVGGGERNRREREEREREEDTWFQLLKRTPSVRKTMAIGGCHAFSCNCAFDRPKSRLNHAVVVTLTTPIFARHAYACNWANRAVWSS